MNFFIPPPFVFTLSRSPLSLDPSAVDKIWLYYLLANILNFLRLLNGNRSERSPSYRPGYRPREPGENASV
jgi:hypothetical protein